MSSKLSNDGTAGLMIIGGMVLFAGLIVWVQGIGVGQKAYNVTVKFEDAKGMQEGTPLRYRGVEIGKAVGIKPSSDSVLVEVEITATDLRIPGDSVIEVQSAALLGEKYMDVIMQEDLPDDPTLPLPTDPACNPEIIICEGSALQGRALPDLADLIRTSYQLSELFTDPLLLATLGQLSEKLLTGASGLSGLGENVSTLTTSLNGQVGTLGKALTSVGNAADKIGTTAGEIESTAITAREILETNRTVMALTLSNFGTASANLLTLMDDLSPPLKQLNEGELLNNVEVLSDNLRRASAKLLVATNAMSDPSNVQMLQETLDSARVTFQNAQKITTDLEELSGDAKLRDDLRRLLGGLGGLFSRAENLENQVRSTQEFMADSTSENLGITGLGSTDWRSWTETVSTLNQQLEAMAAAEPPAQEATQPNPLAENSPEPTPQPTARSTPPKARPANSPRSTPLEDIDGDG